MSLNIFNITESNYIFNILNWIIIKQMDEFNKAQDAEQPKAVADKPKTDAAQDQEKTKLATLLSSMPADMQEPLANYLETVI